jgi:hypothetical protein
MRVWIEGVMIIEIYAFLRLIRTTEVRKSGADCCITCWNLESVPHRRLVLGNRDRGRWCFLNASPSRMKTGATNPRSHSRRFGGLRTPEI